MNSWGQLSSGTGAGGYRVTGRMLSWREIGPVGVLYFLDLVKVSNLEIEKFNVTPAA